jgi:hypothetical protein
MKRRQKKTAKHVTPVVTKVPEVVIPKILIGVPILAWTHEFALSFLNFWTDLMTYQETTRKFHVGYRFIYRKPVHMAEEELAQFAVDSGCTHLLLMDDDIYDIKANDLLTLIDAGKDVIGGIMHTGGFPHAMCAFRRYDTKTKVADQPIMEGPARLYEIPLEQRTGIQKVDLIPFAFTLFKTEIFKKLKKPWFSCNTQAPTDSWFADSVLDAGMEYYAHFGVWLNHRGITRFNQPIHVQLGLQEQQLKQNSSVIMLTPEEMKKHEILMTEKLKTAEAEIKKSDIAKQGFFEKSKDKLIAQPVLKDGVKAIAKT